MNLAGLGSGSAARIVKTRAEGALDVALRSATELFRDAPFDEEVLEPPAAPEGEEVVFDYASFGLTLRTHPMALLRPHLKGRRLMTAGELEGAPSGRLVHYVGIVTLRQQPETANGTVFISHEDKTGVLAARG